MSTFGFQPGRSSGIIDDSVLLSILNRISKLEGKFEFQEVNKERKSGESLLVSSTNNSLVVVTLLYGGAGEIEFNLGVEGVGTFVHFRRAASGANDADTFVIPVGIGQKWVSALGVSGTVKGSFVSTYVILPN